jgi:4-amino-4-deoxy-L-arabinose transferase-like glycosyltransferase
MQGVMTNEGSAAQKALILFVVPLILYLCLLPVLPLMEPDEGRYALIPQAMNATGDFVTPHLKGVVYLEKPPLAYWATALAFKIFGEGEGSARLFSALCAWGCLLLVYAMGAHFHDRKTGLYGAAVFTTMALPFALGRINILDMPLAFFITLSVWFGFLAIREPGRVRKAMLYLLYVAMALAFLTKGLVGVVFPFAILVLWLFCRRRPGDVLRLLSPVGAVLFLALAGPWLYFVQQANPEFFHFFFVQEHFLRYTTTLHERNEPFYYYLPVLAGGTLPWWPYLFQAIRGSRSGTRRLTPRPRFDRDEWSFCLLWAATVFLFFTLSSSKLASYMAPLCPPLAHLMGFFFREGTRHGEPAGFWHRLPGVLQALALAALILVPLSVPEYIRIGQPHWAWLALPVAIQLAILVVPEWLRGR